MGHRGGGRLEAGLAARTRHKDKGPGIKGIIHQLLAAMGQGGEDGISRSLSLS